MELTGVTLGERVREVREAKSLSRTELALRIGLRADRIALIENDEHEPREATVEKLAEALGVTYDDLWGF